MPPLDFYDAELDALDAHLRAVTAVRPHEHVLDVGCGTGLTTRRAARAAVDGRAVGVDLSAPMLGRARRLSAEEGLRNVVFLRTDAATHPFPPARFDLCLSRFGTMFFADPVAAFAGLARALRPGARLALLVWQDRARNEWAREIDRALGLSPPPPDGPGAFSLGDPARTRRILTAAGFARVDLAEAHEPVLYGRDVPAAHAAVLDLWGARGPRTGFDERARDRLRATLAAHETDGGVLFDSRAWLVTATRPGRAP